MLAKLVAMLQRVHHEGDRRTSLASAWWAHHDYATRVKARIDIEEILHRSTDQHLGRDLTCAWQRCKSHHSSVGSDRLRNWPGYRCLRPLPSNRDRRRVDQA